MDKIEALIASINKKFKETVVTRGSDLAFGKRERVPTGSLTLNWALSGGLPRGGIVQFKGPDSSGKSFMSLKACAELQEKYKDKTNIAWASIEGFDKIWARKLGVRIPYSEDEIEELKKLKPNYKEIIDEQNGYGDFLIISSKTSEQVLDVMCSLTESNLFDLIVLDSIGAIISSSEVENSIGKDSMAGSAKMIGRWVRKTLAAFNQWGKDARTSIIVINQLRDQGIGSFIPMRPDGGGGRSLKHGKLADVEFKSGPYKQLDTISKKIVGKTVSFLITKCKIGPERRDGEIDIYFEDTDIWKAGSINTEKEIMTLGVRFGFIKLNGRAFYEYEGTKFHGEETLLSALRENKELSQELIERISSIWSEYN